MAMQMLTAGGIEPFTDKVRAADLDNPSGYYEFERVKALKKEADKSWVQEARGKALKVISHLLPDLPDSNFYRVVFMLRDLHETFASQSKMILRRGEDPHQENEARVLGLYEEHLRTIQQWLDAQPNFEVLYTSYRDVVFDPRPAAVQICKFLRADLDVAKMTSAVKDGLYRNRAQEQVAQ